jgi:hypothetical protein
VTDSAAGLSGKLIRIALTTLFGVVLGFSTLSFAQTSNGAQPIPGLSPQSSEPGLNGLTGGLSSEAPSVKVHEPVYNFGTVFQGTQVKHTFRIENAGPGILTIVGVQTSCGCTVAKPTLKQVQPGEASEISAVFDTSADRGPAQRIITVSTDDPNQKQVALTIKGDVRVKVDANPALVVFDNVKHGVEVSKQVLVTDTLGDKNFKITSVTHSDPNLKVLQLPRTDGKPGAILDVKLLKTAPAESFADVVKVGSNVAPVNIPISGNVIGDLNVSPPQVSFGIVKPRAGAVRFARLTNTGSRKVKVVGVSTNNPNVLVAIQPLPSGNDFKLTLELRPNSPDGTLRGFVDIATDDPGQPKIEVPFYGIVGAFSG